MDARGVRGPAARRLRDGALVRAGERLRVAHAPARAGRHGGDPAPPAGARRGRDDELPRRHRRRAGRARAARSVDGATHADGHAPGVVGRALDAYVAAGIRSDHEATTFDEALEKRRRGMWVLLREASNARNLRDLLPLVGQYGPEHCAFCTDDREPDFLYRDGHIDQMCRVAVEEGVLARGGAADGHAAPRALPRPDGPRRDRPRPARRPRAARRPRDLPRRRACTRTAGWWPRRPRRAVRAPADPRARAQHHARRPAARRRLRDPRRRARARDRDDPGPAHHARARGGRRRRATASSSPTRRATSPRSP